MITDSEWERLRQEYEQMDPNQQRSLPVGNGAVGLAIAVKSICPACGGANRTETPMIRLVEGASKHFWAVAHCPCGQFYRVPLPEQQLYQARGVVQHFDQEGAA